MLNIEQWTLNIEWWIMDIEDWILSIHRASRMFIGGAHANHWQINEGYWKQLRINENQWNNYKSIQNQRKPLRVNENNWKSMTSIENQWISMNKSMKTNWKTMDNHWKTMEIPWTTTRIHWKSLLNHTHAQKQCEHVKMFLFSNGFSKPNPGPHNGRLSWYIQHAYWNNMNGGCSMIIIKFKYINIKLIILPGALNFVLP